jgi:hypothetical protein
MKCFPKSLRTNPAEYIDVFLETGYFTQAETEQIMEVGTVLA